MTGSVGKFLLLLLAPVLLIPGVAPGLVLCVDDGPDAHVALEWASCCDAEASGPAADPLSPRGRTGDAADTGCEDCEDIPLAAAREDALPRTRFQPAPFRPSLPAPCLENLLPASRGPAPTGAALPEPLPPAVPLALRV